MARTRKAIQSLELYKYDVLIEDRGPRSEYFKISQFDGYFYGGRNAFLIAGASVLRPGSDILIEILNKNGTTVYSVPVKDFIEGSSRLIQIEVYEDTPIGPGKIIVLGSVDTYTNGTPVPDEWKGKYNVRWIADVIISPLIENKTPIRFRRPPSIDVEEKFYARPATTQLSQSVAIPVDVELTTKYYNVFPNGYVVKLKGPGTERYYTKYLGGVITGSIRFNTSAGPETASIQLPIERIYNTTTAESVGSLIYTNNKILITAGGISSSGEYQGNIAPFGSVGITSSINLVYSEVVTENTASSVSFASIRLTDLNTISGEVHKARLSYKSTTSPSNFTIIGDVNLNVAELLAVDTGSKIANTGNFRDVVLSDYWYAATSSFTRTNKNPSVPNYYYTSSLANNALSLTQCCTDLLDSINATPPISSSLGYNNLVSYFIGSKESTPIQLFPRSEYTLSFEALATISSASISWAGADTTLEAYLIPTSGSSTRLLEINPKGQFIGSIQPRVGFLKQNFETVEFNFVPNIIEPGEFSVRFIIYGAFWNIANVSVKPAEEPFFSPDEVSILLPNDFKSEDLISFRAEYLDVNNNSLGIQTTSEPTYFTGSRQYVLRTGDTIEGNLNVIGELSASIYVVPNALEPATISATSANVTVNYDALDKSVLYYTSNAAGNWTLNVRGNASTTLDSIMDVGDSRTVTFLVTNGTPAYYQTAFQIDGSNIVPKWQGGTTPTSGATNSVDIYSFSIIKTATATFTVFASKVQFS